MGWLWLWKCPDEVSQLEDPDWLNSLSADERSRADRFIHQQHRQHFLSAHIGMRRRLAKHLQLPPEQIKWDVGPFGKPVLKSKTVAFNLSHCGPWAALAVSKHDIGLDLEQIIPARSMQASASHILHPEEPSMLDGPMTDELLIHYWSAKESVLKATGMGMSMPPCTVKIGRLPSLNPKPLLVHTPQGVSSMTLIQVHTDLEHHVMYLTHLSSPSP